MMNELVGWVSELQYIDGKPVEVVRVHAKLNAVVPSGAPSHDSPNKLQTSSKSGRG
jgi:hypothetical protein